MGVLVVDIGTTNVKAGVVDEWGNLHGLSFRELKLEKPEPGAAVHDPDTIFRAVIEVSRDAVRKYGGKIDALALSGYLFGLLPLDEYGKPLSGIITWLDTRARGVAEEIKNTIDKRELYSRTGCPPLFIYPLAKIIWLRRYKPDLFEKTAIFLGAKDYILYRLLGRYYAERSTASGTQLLNTLRLTWDEYSLSLAGIDEEKLPILVDSDKIISYIPREKASLLGVDKSIPVIPGVFDGASVAIGEGGFREGICTSHISTSAMLRVASKKPVVDKSSEMRFQTYYLLSHTWLPGGAVNNAGIVLRWFRDNFGHVEKNQAKLLETNPYSLMDIEASKAPPGSAGLIFLPYVSGERFPNLGNLAKGVLFGLTLEHTRHHVIRALMEGTMLNLAIIMEALEENGLSVEEIRVTGGGAKSRLWLQILADITGVSVRKVLAEDAALLGSAVLAYTALDIYRDIGEAIDNMVRVGDRVVPGEKNVAVYRELFNYFKKLMNSLVALYGEHQRLVERVMGTNS